MRVNRHHAAAYITAMAAVIIASGVRIAIDEYVGDNVPYATYFVAVVVAAAAGGLGPALLAVAASVPLAVYLFVPPRLTFVARDWPDLVGIEVFVVASLAIAFLGEAMWAARRRVEFERESLRVTLESIGDAVITTDVEGRVSFMNPIAQRLTGWMGESALGQPLESVFVIVNEETRAAVANPARRALRDGTIVGLSNHTVLISRDGTERPIDDSAAPIRNREGEVAGSVLVFRDITERRRGERELRTSEVRFRTMADSIAQLAWIANAEGRFQWFNRRWYDYTGTTPAQMAAPGGWQSVHAPDEWPRVIERWQASIVTGEPFDMVVQIRGADGDYRPFLTRIAPVSDDEGRVVQWFGTKTDVSEVKRAEEALREADRRKDEFLATLAHELRNPLAPIRYALAVMENAGGNVTLLERARLMMERHIAQMVRLIDDLLDVSRISRGKLSLRMERVDLATVMTDAVDTVRPLVEAGGQRLIVAYPTEPMLIMADATRLAQVFANLLNNSAKYTEPDGEIHFGARVSGGFAYVTVRDTGVGIPPEELSRIFEMFSQVDRTVERSQGGLGIGLTLVKRLVEMHGGTISAHSDGDGKGAEFTVALPLPPAPGHVQADAGTQAGAV